MGEPCWKHAVTHRGRIFTRKIVPADEEGQNGEQGDIPATTCSPVTACLFPGTTTPGRIRGRDARTHAPRCSPGAFTCQGHPQAQATPAARHGEHHEAGTASPLSSPPLPSPSSSHASARHPPPPHPTHPPPSLSPPPTTLAACDEHCTPTRPGQPSIAAR